MCPWLVFFTCCLHLFTQKYTYPIESGVSPLQLLTLDSSLDLIWAAQQHFVCFQQILAWTHSWPDLTGPSSRVDLHLTTVVITTTSHIMNLHCTILYGQRWLTIGRILWASGGQAGLQGVAMIYGPACVWNCHHNTRSSLGVGHP